MISAIYDWSIYGTAGPGMKTEVSSYMNHSILIADTTREEREQIIAESIGNISGLCDGCSPGIIEMYQEYIDGKKELREINAEFRARYMSGASGPEKSTCDYAG